MTPTAFTRNRRLPLPSLVAFLLNAPCAGLKPDLEAFFDDALGGGEASAPTKSALCQARRQLRPEALRELLSHSAWVFADDSQVELWHGRRVLALDGTTLRVPDVPECAAHFGGMQTSCGKFRPLARATDDMRMEPGGWLTRQTSYSDFWEFEDESRLEVGDMGCGATPKEGECDDDEPDEYRRSHTVRIVGRY